MRFSLALFGIFALLFVGFTFYEALVIFEVIPVEFRHDDIGWLTSPGEKGQFGDLVGGVLNPVLAFLSFVALLYTIHIQNKELAHSTEELARSATASELQNFETTFFNMLNLLLQIVKETDHYSNNQKKNLSGRTALNSLGGSILNLHHNFSPKNNPDRIEEKERIEKIYILNSRREMQDLEAAFITDYMQDNDVKLGHYFRIIYNILRVIKEYTPEAQDKELYVRILKANFSDLEFYLIFYNCLTEQGFKLKELVEELELLDNMSAKRLMRKETVTQFDRSAFGKNKAVLAIYDETVRSGSKESLIYPTRR